jgi:uncharacterized protein (DUF488 family)
MLTRQKILLQILVKADGQCTKIELTKLSFLLAKEGRSEQLKTFYEFVPYLFGPYSFTLNHELEHLVRSGFIKLPDENIIELTAFGKKNAPSEHDPRLLRDFELLQMNYLRLSQSKLVDRVYEKYPWFTLNSKSTEKRKVTKKLATCANYTIGYQTFQVDGLLNRLLESGISKLIDTRSNPISRRYGFHKSSLSRFCQNVGLQYEHLPQLGIPSSWRQELNSEKAYIALFDRYEKEILAKEKNFVADVANNMLKSPTALLCQEAEPVHCHRTRLAKTLESLNRLPIVELGARCATAIL